MFVFALITGIYAYLLFALGIGGLLYKEAVIFLTVYLIGTFVVWKREYIFSFLQSLFIATQKIKGNVLLVFILLFILQILVNVIGVLGPELAFDALWYHLTIPKIWLLNHSITFIPGGLLYYSAMPKLGELLFLPGLAMGNEIAVKFIHFSFGLLTCLALYKLQRKFFNPLISLIGVVIFYSNLVVAWESITAYVDLIRAFFEIMALWGFINWFEKKEKQWFILSAIMVGFAITTKLLAIGSLIIFSILIVWVYRAQLKNTIIGLLAFWFIALLIPFPWFIFAYIHTGNPVYPFFTEIYKVAPEALSVIGFFTEVWTLFTKSSDPISPIYLIFLPLLILFFKRIHLSAEIKLIGIYSLLAIIIWYFTPRTGGGRFMLPYLPALSILCAALLYLLMKETKKYSVLLFRYLLGIIILTSVISIGYRAAANAKYFPVILGQQTKGEFLTTHLNFSFGDFYDTDNYFKKHITEKDRVLLYGFHNLYYIDFPFIDSSWVKEGDTFNYIATQNTTLPKKYQAWKLVYKNDKTMVKLYKQ